MKRLHACGPLRPALFVVLLLLAAALPARAQRPGNFGIGVLLGGPTGLSMKFYTGPARAYDLLVHYDSDPDHLFVQGHAILTERPLNVEPRISYFIGPGLFVGSRERPDDDYVYMGLSLNIGLSFFIDRLEIFGQLTPAIQLVPDTEGDLPGGIGARFYF